MSVPSLAALIGATLLLFGAILWKDRQTQDAMVKVTEVLGARRTQIETITTIRRDSRKMQVLVLEQFLSPSAERAAQAEMIQRRVDGLLGTAGSFAEGKVGADQERDDRKRLVDAVNAWSKVIESALIADDPVSAVHDLALGMSELDRAAESILRRTSTTASAEDTSLASLHRTQTRLRVISLTLLIAIAGGAAWLRAKMVARARHAESIAEALERYEALVESANAVPWEMDTDSETIVFCAPTVFKVLGRTQTDLMGKPIDWRLIADEDRERVRRTLAEFLRSKPAGTQPEQVDCRILRPDGQTVEARTILSRCVHGQSRRLHAITFDITRQKRLEFELHQALRLEAVGRLAAGIAHEINTPVQFVSDSVLFIREAVADLLPMIDGTRTEGGSSQARSDGADPKEQGRAAEELETDCEYLVTELPKAIERCLEGLNRVTTIVCAMKEFAHPGGRDMAAADLNHAIRSTLVVARNEYKYVAEIELHLGDIPPVTCCISDVSQAMLNIIVNAAHAIADAADDSGGLGRITIRSWTKDDSVVISISDTGTGIPASVRNRIFEPFFTTKEVGKGTGQGLAIARSIVVDKHRGNLTVETHVGKGTTFFIALPIRADHDTSSRREGRAEPA